MARGLQAAHVMVEVRGYGYLLQEEPIAGMATLDGGLGSRHSCVVRIV